MREYWILTKLQLSSLFGVNKIRHARSEETKKQARKNLTAFIVMAVMLLWASSVYSAALGVALWQIGQLPYLLGLMSAATGALILLFSLLEAKGVLFSFGDDTVFSFPVRDAAVAAARVTTMFAYNLVYTVLLMLPAGVVYAVAAHPPVWFYPVYLICMFVIPAIPTVLGAMAGTLVTAATARMKKRGPLTAVFQILFALGVMALSMGFNRNMDGLIAQAEDLGARIGTIWPPAAWLMRASTGDMAQLLLLASASALSVALFIWVMTKTFRKIDAHLSAVPHAKARALRIGRSEGAVRALYRVEWKRYIGSSLYLANTAFGYVMLLIAAVVLSVVHPPAVDAIFAEPAMRRALPLVAALIAAMSATTFSAISMEGKRLWIVKSMPVRACDWLTAKLAVSLTPAVPSIVLYAVLTGIGLRLNAWEWALNLLVPLSYALLYGALGLAVNLRLPKFDWTREAEVVKQSAATFIGVCSGMLTAGLPLGLTLGFGLPWIPAAAAALAVLAAGLIMAGLHKHAKARLYRLL